MQSEIVEHLRMVKVDNESPIALSDLHHIVDEYVLNAHVAVNDVLFVCCSIP